MKRSQVRIFRQSHFHHLWIISAAPPRRAASPRVRDHARMHAFFSVRMSSSNSSSRSRNSLWEFLQSLNIPVYVYVCSGFTSLVMAVLFLLHFSYYYAERQQRSAATPTPTRTVAAAFSLSREQIATYSIHRTEEENHCGVGNCRKWPIRFVAKIRRTPLELERNCFLIQDTFDACPFLPFRSTCAQKTTATASFLSRRAHLYRATARRSGLPKLRIWSFSDLSTVLENSRMVTKFLYTPRTRSATDSSAVLSSRL